MSGEPFQGKPGLLAAGPKEARCGGGHLAGSADATVPTVIAPLGLVCRRTHPKAVKSAPGTPFGL